MTDLSKIKRNVAKMASMNAPEEDIDGYIASEGVTIDDVRNHKLAQPDSALKRGLFGAIDPAIGIGQMIAHVPDPLGFLRSDDYNRSMEEGVQKIDSAVKQREEEYKARNEGLEGIDWSRIIGNILSPANAVVGSAAGKLSPAKNLIGKMAQGAGIGGGYSATAPVTDGDFASGKMGQIGTGMAVGGFMPLAGETVARVVKPNGPTANVQKLIDENVRLTPGQILGGGWQTAEDKMTSIPILGDMISSARKGSLEDMNRAVGNRVLDPIGEKVGPKIEAGHDLVNYVDDSIEKAYKDIIPKLTGKPDQQFFDDIAGLSGLASNLPPEQSKMFENILQTNIFNKLSKNGSLTGDSIKEIESTLGKEARGYMSDAAYDNRKLGAAIKEAQSSLRKMLVRQNPDHAERLKNVNEAYATFVRMRDAAGSTASKEGVFSPTQLSLAVKRNSFGKGQYAKGDALMQDLSDAAKDVLPSRVPDSGTAGRMIANLLMGGGLPLLSLPAAGVGAAATSLYTKPGMKMVEALLTKRPDAAKPIADAVRKITSPADLARLLMSGNVAAARSP